MGVKCRNIYPADRTRYRYRYMLGSKSKFATNTVDVRQVNGVMIHWIRYTTLFYLTKIYGDWRNVVFCLHYTAE